MLARRQVLPRPERLDGVFGRHLRPRYLCVIDDDPRNPDGYRIEDVDKWDTKRPEQTSGGYVFVSYTRSQFQTYQTYKSNDPRITEAVFRTLEAMYMPDLQELVAIGKAAAKSANIKAFWIDLICLPSEVANVDSHGICDIVRGADRMVIAVKYECLTRVFTEEQGEEAADMDVLLQSWASRLWTLPELLLAPTRHDLTVYQVRANDPYSTDIPVDVIPKRNMAERAYQDGLLVRKLVDHFESSLHLTQIELLTIGLECLLNRKYSAHLKTDPIYALMTLSQRRPTLNADGTLFEAFAQLSLLNDSNMLLERLLCILPPIRGIP